MGDVLGRQHTHMFVYGEKGGQFSLESMRKDAALRLKRGWVTTIHHHTSAEDCPADPDSKCEHYEPEKTEKPS